MSELDGLAELLHSKTLAGKIVWVTRGNPGWLANYDIRLETIQGENYIEVAKSSDVEPEMIELTIRNRDGIVLARGGFGTSEKPYGELDDIVDIVRRQSLGVDGALSDLRARLEAL